MSSNEYGLDVTYFRLWLDRLSDITRYRPSELARELARMSRTADDKVMLEDEFAGKRIAELKQQLADKQKQIDELNAKAAAIADAFDDVALGVISIGASGVHCGLESYQRLRDVINNSPFQSLAEHDARVIESLTTDESLVYWCDDWDCYAIEVSHLQKIIKDLRKQGEE